LTYGCSYEPDLVLPGSLYFRVALDSLSFAKKTTTACSLAFHCFAFILYIKRSPWTPKICLWTPGWEQLGEIIRLNFTLADVLRQLLNQLYASLLFL